MSLKLKVLGLGLLATLAMSAVAVSNAGAEVSGHFVSDSKSGTTLITGSESTHTFTHKIEFSAAGLPSEPIYCTHSSFTGTLLHVLTTQDVRIKPTYSNCATTQNGQPGGAAATVDFKECEYSFTPDNTSTHAAAGLVCPAGQQVTITDASTGCTLRFGTQEITNAVTYTTDTFNGKHSITLDATATGVKFTAHGGLCVFVGTNRTDGVMSGSATVHAEDSINKEIVNITHT